MSNYGMHATRTKAEAKAALPVGACHECVRWFRLFGVPHYPMKGAWWKDRVRDVAVCPNCGTGGLR